MIDNLSQLRRAWYEMLSMEYGVNDVGWLKITKKHLRDSFQIVSYSDSALLDNVQLSEVRYAFHFYYTFPTNLRCSVCLDVLR